MARSNGRNGEPGQPPGKPPEEGQPKAPSGAPASTPDGELETAFDDHPSKRKFRPAQGKRGPRLTRTFRRRRPGASPGIEPSELPPPPAFTEGARITCIDYSAEHFELQEVRDLAAFVRDHRPPWSAVRWINVDGLSDLGVVRAIAEKYHLHPLAVEDVLHVPQRPKVQAYDETGEYQARLFVIMRMMALQQGELQSEQVSLFVGHHTVITFQESPGDVWDPIRQRLRSPKTRLRSSADASFLGYALIDAVVDQGFPILEHFGDRLELLEDVVLQRPSRESFQEVHRVKRELLLLRRAMWPMREVVQQLAREPHECFSALTQTYMRDVYDHAVQVIDILETYREIASDLTDTYMNAVSNRMTEIMKVLTIIGTVFIPLTFLAGVYGMNFKHFPELEWRWGYAGFWGVCLLVAGGMLAWLRSRRWL